MKIGQENIFFYFLLLKVQELLSLSQILDGKMHSIKNAMKYFNFFFAFTLTPKGLALPYVGFSDSGHADVNAFYF
jgi:hypothetical protein